MTNTMSDSYIKFITQITITVAKGREPAVCPSPPSDGVASKKGIILGAETEVGPKWASDSSLPAGGGECPQENV